MKKLGKKVHEMLDTIEAYCNCGCSCGCNISSCTCYSASESTVSYSSLQTSVHNTGYNSVFFGMGNSLAK